MRVAADGHELCEPNRILHLALSIMERCSLAYLSDFCARSILKPSLPGRFLLPSCMFRIPTKVEPMAIEVTEIQSVQPAIFHQSPQNASRIVAHLVQSCPYPRSVAQISFKSTWRHQALKSTTHSFNILKPSCRQK